MSKQKSVLVGGMGLASNIVSALVAEANEQGLPDEELYKLGGPDGRATIKKFIASLIAETKKAVSTIYRVVVDHHKNFAEMVAEGNYDYLNSDINANNFPVDGQLCRKETDIVLVYLNRAANTEQVLAEMDRKGLRPATIAELLSIGAKYPNLQREFPIVALGSVWQDRYGPRYVPYLDGLGSERDLHLSWVGDDWSELCRFAAVRK